MNSGCSWFPLANLLSNPAFWCNNKMSSRHEIMLICFRPHDIANKHSFVSWFRPARLEAVLQQRRESRPRHQYDLCQRISCCYYGSQDKIHRIYHQNVDMVVIKSPNYETELRNDSSSIPTASSTKEVILNMDNTNAAKQNAICKDWSLSSSTSSETFCVSGTFPKLGYTLSSRLKEFPFLYICSSVPSVIGLHIIITKAASQRTATAAFCFGILFTPRLLYSSFLAHVA
jgi:hypothetical protein